MPYSHPLCEVLPLPEHQAAFLIAGQERVRWHFGASYPRPFFYPFVGPSGRSLTRMGHPGAANHDHHRSIWFAHEKVQGDNFWSDQTETRIRQKQWLAYQDGKDEALMAVLLGWYGSDSAELLQQELIACVRPEENGETLLELQSTFRPTAETLDFGKSNFGFLAVRVAKHLSAYFGGGRLTNSEGLITEEVVFGKRARWMDYSGPVPSFGSGGLLSTDEGITYFDHPGNPGYPTGWHVRSDGWMALRLAWKSRCPPRGTNPSCCATCCMLIAGLSMPTVPKSLPPALRAVAHTKWPKPKCPTWSTSSDAYRPDVLLTHVVGPASRAGPGSANPPDNRFAPRSGGRDAGCPPVPLGSRDLLPARTRVLIQVRRESCGVR